MWNLLSEFYWLRCFFFSHRRQCFQLMGICRRNRQIFSEVKVLSKRRREVLPCSVMLTGPHCQSKSTAHQTSAPNPLSHTEGTETRRQIIWQEKGAIFIRSSTPSQNSCQNVLGGPFSHISYRGAASIPCFIIITTYKYTPHSFFWKKNKDQPSTKLIKSL